MKYIEGSLCACRPCNTYAARQLSCRCILFIFGGTLALRKKGLETRRHHALVHLHVAE